mgnify:CR=1 FL=1
MSATFTIRMPKEFKKKMEKNPAYWSHEISDFLEERVKQMELIKTIEEIEPKAEKRKTNIDSATFTREDRERQN